MNSPSHPTPRLPIRLEMELVSGGFCWEKKRAPMSFVDAKRPKSSAKKYDPEYKRAYNRRQRERWLLKGIVQPKNDAERAWLAEQRKEGR